MKKYIVLSENNKVYIYEVSNLLCLTYFLYDCFVKETEKRIEFSWIISEIVTYKKMFLIDLDTFLNKNMLEVMIKSFDELKKYLNSLWLNNEYLDKLIFGSVNTIFKENGEESLIFLLCSGIYGIRFELEKRINENLKKSKIKNNTIEIIDLEMDIIEKEIKAESIFDLKKFKTIEEVVK